MAFTKVTGPGIHTLSNIISHNIDSSGIITATKFVGTVEGPITGDLVTNDWITHEGDTNTRIGFPDNDKVEIQTGGGLALHVNSTQKVGIGTDDIDHNLHVYQKAGDAVVTIESQGNGNDAALEFIRTSSGGDSKGAGSIYVTGDASASEAKLQFGVGHNISHAQLPRMTIMGNGEVGIGTENATDTLHVGKLNSNHGIKLERYGATNPGSSTIQVHSHGALNVTSSNNITYTSGGSQKHVWMRGSTEVLNINSTGQLLLGPGPIATTKATLAGSLDLGSGGISLCIGGDENNTGRTNSTNKLNRVASPHYTNAEEPVAMVSSYNVSNQSIISYGGGSGLTNAATKHSFYTAANTTTTSGTERLRINSTGHVTIGEADFTASNDVHIKRANGGGDVALRITNNSTTNSGTKASLYFTTSSTQDFNTAYINAVRDGGKLNFGYATNSPTVTMKVSTGTVGIGEDDPDDNKLLIRAATTVGTNKGHIMLTGDSATNGQGPQIVFSESGSGSSYAGAYVGHIREGSNSTGSLVFGTRSTGGDASTVPDERIRIYSTGQILYSAASGDNTITSKRTNSAGSNGNYFFHLKAQASGGTNVGALGFHRDTNTDDSRLVFFTKKTGGSESLQERLRITSDGRIIPAITGGTGGMGLVGAFMARPSSTYSTNNGLLKITLGSEEFDANGWFDTSNSRYTPLCKGWYQFNFFIQYRTNINGQAIELFCYPYKNGASANGGPVHGWDDNYGNYAFITFSTMIYCDGVDDYIEFYANCSRSTEVSVNSRMSGFLVHPVA